MIFGRVEIGKSDRRDLAVDYDRVVAFAAVNRSSVAENVNRIVERRARDAPLARRIDRLRARID